MQLNKTNLQNLYKGFRTIFMAAYQAAPQGDVVDGLAMRVPTMNASEVLHWLGAIPGMQKLIDEIQIKNLVAHKYTIDVNEWESTIAVKQADVERDRTGIYTPLFGSMGDVARQHDGEQLALQLVNGFTTLCYTGKNFFDTDHEPVKKGTKFSNKGTKKFSQTNFRTARTNIRGRLNSAGRSMNLGRDLVLIVSPTYESEAREVLEAERGTNGKTNVDKGTSRLLVWNELSAAGNEHAWFLSDFAQTIKPLIVLDEKPVNILALDDLEADHVFKNHEFLYQGYKRCGYGYGLPELIYGSTGADAA